MSYLSSSAFSSTGCFFGFDTARRSLALDVLVFQFSLRFKILSSWDGMTLRHGDCALIGEVQFLLQDYLTDSWIASRYRSQDFLSYLLSLCQKYGCGDGKDRVRRAYTLGSSSGKSSSSWVAGGLQKVHIDFFVEDTMSGDFLICFVESLRANVPRSLLEWPNLFWLQQG